MFQKKVSGEQISVSPNLKYLLLFSDTFEDNTEEDHETIKHQTGKVTLKNLEDR